MRILFCADHEGAVDFLEAHQYPLLDLHRETLNECGLLSITASDGDVVGYIWTRWVPDSDYVLSLHTYLHPEFRGRWLNRKIITDMISYCRMMNARHVLCSPIYKDIGDQLERLGFTKTSIGYAIKII